MIISHDIFWNEVRLTRLLISWESLKRSTCIVFSYVYMRVLCVGTATGVQVPAQLTWSDYPGSRAPGGSTQPAQHGYCNCPWVPGKSIVFNQSRSSSPSPGALLGVVGVNVLFLSSPCMCVHTYVCVCWCMCVSMCCTYAHLEIRIQQQVVH